MFFKAVVHAVLLFGLEEWMLTPRMGWALGSPHHRVSSQITGRQPKIQEKGEWEYPPLAAVMEEAGFGEIGAYILKRQSTFAQYVATRKIMDLCKKAVWRLGDWVDQRWWEKEGIDLEGVRTWATVAADGEEERKG